MVRSILNFRLNGQDRTELIDGADTLLALLRYRLELTSIKHGCKQGTCGSCTVIVDGQPRLACLTLALNCEGSDIQSLEALPSDDGLHPLQLAFMSQFAAQCGFCTPGMLMAAKALLDVNPNPTREEVVEAISGNICRCTGYEPIIDAILTAAQGERSREDKA